MRTVTLRRFISTIQHLNNSSEVSINPKYPAALRTKEFVLGTFLSKTVSPRFETEQTIGRRTTTAPPVDPSAIVARQSDEKDEETKNVAKSNKKNKTSN